MAILVELQKQGEKNDCTEVQLMFEQEMKKLMNKLEESFAKHDSLMKTNEDLNKFILDLQTNKDNLQKENQQL